MVYVVNSWKWGFDKQECDNCVLPQHNIGTEHIKMRVWLSKVDFTLAKPSHKKCMSTTCRRSHESAMTQPRSSNHGTLRFSLHDMGWSMVITSEAIWKIPCPESPGSFCSKAKPKTGWLASWKNSSGNHRKRWTSMHETSVFPKEIGGVSCICIPLVQRVHHFQGWSMASSIQSGKVEASKAWFQGPPWPL